MINLAKKIFFIINPISGRGKGERVIPILHEELPASKFKWSYELTTHKGHAIELAKEAVSKDIDIIVAVGGDGTVNEVASALINTNKILGIIPAGSGNGLAMHIGLGRNLTKAIRYLSDLCVMEIDTCEVNDKSFVNLSGIGFDGLVSYRISKSKIRGLFGYFIHFLKASWSYEPQEFEFYIDKEKYNNKYLLIEIANGPMFGYNFTIAPFAKIDDGQLEVVLIKDAPKWKYFGLMPLMLMNKINKSGLIERISTKSIRFIFRENTYVHFDGEGYIKDNITEMKYTIKPKSLKIICNKNNFPQAKIS